MCLAGIDVSTTLQLQGLISLLDFLIRIMFEEFDPFRLHPTLCPYCLTLSP